MSSRRASSSCSTSGTCRYIYIYINNTFCCVSVLKIVVVFNNKVILKFVSHKYLLKTRFRVQRRDNSRKRGLLKYLGWVDDGKTVLSIQLPCSSNIGSNTAILTTQLKIVCYFVCLMVFNSTFNNISFISWRSVLLVEETGVPGENHRPVASH